MISRTPRKSAPSASEHKARSSFRFDDLPELIKNDRIDPNPCPRKKKLFRYWPYVKGDPYGPDPKQKLPWIERMPYKLRKAIAHFCNWDILLLIGGTRSGKSIAATARVVYLCRKYPGTKAIVGSVNFTHLEETTIEDCYKPLFTKYKAWDHPSILRKPTRSHKRIEFKNGSVISFVNLDEKNYLKVLGKGVDVIHIEEPELLKTVEPLMILLTRLSGKATPIKQVILTANPTEDLSWMIDYFSLEQFEEDYAGERKPIGRPCICHLCSRCKKNIKKEVEYIDGICPECGKKKKATCPGRQYFARVVILNAEDNTHVDEGYLGHLASTLSADNFQRFGKGFVLRKRRGSIYSCYSGRNVYHADKQINPHRPLIWCLDFNNRPQCSVVCQEFHKDGLTHVRVLQEINLYDAGPDEVAKLFIKLYKRSGVRRIHLYADPTSWNGPIANVMLSKFGKVIEVLEACGRFDVSVMTPKTIYPIDHRINSVNWMLRDGNDYSRLHINPSCKQLISGFERIFWNKAGTKEDETEDRKAREKGRNGTFWPGLTHHVCALGYFIVEKHPMIPLNRKPDPYYQFTGTGNVVSFKEGGKKVVKTRYTENDLVALEKSRKEYWEDEADRSSYYEDTKSYNPPSFASLLRAGGSWGR